MKKYVVVLLTLLLMGCEMVVREPAVAGSWYPGDNESILNTIDDYFRNAPPVEIDGRIKAMIVPHAGWKYSGFIAASAFKLLEGSSYNTIIVIGPSHTADFSGASIPSVTHYKTPLGVIKLSKKIKALLGGPNFVSHESAHTGEHSIEIELPFLQKTLGEFELIPILIGSSTSYEQLEQIADSLRDVIDDSTLIVISSDFTHFGFSYGYMPFTENIEENLKNLDQGAVDFIARKDPKGFYDYVTETEATICGRHPITVLLNILQGSGSKVKLGAYDTSGRQAKDFRNSVSYVSLIFYGGSIAKNEEVLAKDKGDITEDEKIVLMKLARDTIDLYVREGKVLEPDMGVISKYPKLQEKRGAFVSLDKNGMLRGSIGHLLPYEPLYLAVRDNAISAVSKDRRFEPVQPDELEDIEITVSVLGIPILMEVGGWKEYLDILVPLKDGVTINYLGRQSTYLPQVWSQLPDKETFLSQLCKKQGSIPDCWKDPNVKIHKYSAQVFYENEIQE